MNSSNETNDRHLKNIDLASYDRCSATGTILTAAIFAFVLVGNTSYHKDNDNDKM